MIQIKDEWKHEILCIIVIRNSISAYAENIRMKNETIIEVMSTILLDFQKNRRINC